MGVGGCAARGLWELYHHLLDFMEAPVTVGVQHTHMFQNLIWTEVAWGLSCHILCEVIDGARALKQLAYGAQQISELFNGKLLFGWGFLCREGAN